MHSFSWQGTVPAKINLLGALHCIEMRSSCFPTKLWKWSSNSTQQELSLAYSIPSPASSWVYLGASPLFSYVLKLDQVRELRSSPVPQCYSLHKASVVPTRSPKVQEWPHRTKCSPTHKPWRGSRDECCLWDRRMGLGKSKSEEVERDKLEHGEGKPM